MSLSRRDCHFWTRRRRSRSGQGVVEYILLLVVAIMLMFGVTYQFNDAFRNWAQNYFGDYLSCLLETGELPAIGGTGGTSSACADLFQPFSLASGRPHDGPGSGPGGGGGGGGGDDDGGDGRPRDSGPSGVGEGAGAGYTKVGSRFGDGAGRERRFRGRNANSKAAANRGRPRNVYTGSTEDSIPASALSGSSRAGVSRRRLLEGDFYIAKDNRREERIDRVPAKISEASAKVERRERLLVKKKLKETRPAEADRPMTFGDYFRYLIIAAIIIALLVVIGGQMAQMSNELD